MLKATEITYFGQLISQKVPFIVPLYQRPYAWEEDQVDDFITDFKELYKARLENLAHPKKHFFGGIVSVERYVPDLSDMGHAYDLIDGQQRLATLMLTIALLIKALNELAQAANAMGDQQTALTADSHASTIRESCLVYKEVVGSQTQEKVRLVLSKTDAAFFEGMIKDHTQHLQPSTASHNRLLEAWSLIEKELIRQILDDDPSPDNADKLKRLLTLRSCVLQDCYFIHLSSDEISEAYRLFAVLNDRGKTLSEGDLLRVYTLEMLEDNRIQQNRVEYCWDEILSNSYEEVRMFLHAYYPSWKGERAPSSDFVDKFREQFFNYRRPLSIQQAMEITTRLDQMREEINNFREIYKGNWPYETPTVSQWERSQLSYLIIALDHTLCLPLLLSACRGLSESAFAELVSLLNRFVFRYIRMVGVHAGSLGKIYYEEAVNIRQFGSRYNIANLQKRLVMLQQANAPDNLFEDNMRQKLNYKYPRKVIKYFLITIEDYLPWYKQGLRGKPTVDKSRSFDLNQITFEHIYPVRPASQDPELEPLKQDIGNLSFWGPNENNMAANAPFADKKLLYAQSMVMLNRELAKLPDWNKQELEKRKDELINIAKRIFTA